MQHRASSTSLDITQENIQRLKELFPEVLTDSEKIDFDLLRTVLGEVVEDNNERYSFNWHGKKAAILGAQKPSKGTLRPVKEKSKNFDTTENLYIEGDNLEVLKLLQKSYNNKIKMIYIDPPYNTGHDFVYKDDFTRGVDNYLEQTGQVDSDGNILSTNSESNGRFHTDWLNMMYPRLKLARNLLTDDGAIFISIDDNELGNLLAIMNEIFNEKNVKVITVKMSESSGLKMASVKKQGTIPKLKEYIIVAKKDGIKNLFFAPIPKDKWDNEYNIYLDNFTQEDKNIINNINEKGNITEKDIELLDQIARKVTLQSLNDVVKKLNLSSDNEIEQWKKDNSYRICQCVTSASILKLAEQKKKICNQNLFFVKSNSGELAYFVRGGYGVDSKKPRLQLIFAEDNLTVHPGDFWNDIKTTGLDNEGAVPFKNGKKPLRLIRRLIKSATQFDKNAIILDFFSGSATTGHAVMDLNSSDNGKRKFILVQLPEKIEETTDEYKQGYSNICDLGEERIRRAGEKVKAEIKEKQQKTGIIDSNGVDPESLDIGFKVLKLDKSNIREWNADFKNLDETLDLFEDVFVEGRSELDIVYEIMLKNGLELTYPVNSFQVEGKNIYDIAYGNLFICLDDIINSNVAKAIIEKRDEYGIETSTVVFKDAGFKGNDSEKLNCIELLKDAGYPEDNLLTI